MASRDDRAGHVRAAVHARTDDQPLPEWATGGAGRARPAGSHPRGPARGRHDGRLARVWKHHGGYSVLDSRTLGFALFAADYPTRDALGDYPRDPLRIVPVA